MHEATWEGGARVPNSATHTFVDEREMRELSRMPAQL